MGAVAILAAVELITLHMIDGRVVQINPQQVTQLVSGRPAGDPGKSLPDAVQLCRPLHRWVLPLRGGGLRHGA